MKYLIMILLMFGSKAFGSNLVECDGSQLTFEIQTYSREGNEERNCPVNDDYPSHGTAFIYFNNQPVYMFSHGQTRDFCTGVNVPEPTPAIYRGCVSKNFINRSGPNLVTTSISNVSDQTYVNATESAYIVNGGAIFLSKWSRQGKGQQQVFSGQTSVTLSAFILSTSGYESAQRLVNFRSILDRLVDLTLLNSKDLDKWHALLDSLLDMDARNIILSALPAETPSWFVDLIKSIQIGSESTERENKELSESIEKTLSSNQQKIAESLASLESTVDEIDTKEELKLDQDELDDNQIKEREHNYLNQLQSLIDNSKRAEFLQAVYSWEEESKVATDFAIEVNADKPGYYATFLSSQTRIMDFVRKYVDENYYFRDVTVSDAFKNLVENGLKSRNPDLSKRIKELLNLRYKKTVAGDKALRHLEFVTEGYVHASDKDGMNAHALLIDDMIAFIEKAEDFAECLVKTNIAGLYASFYEVVEGRNFCDDSPMETLDRTLSFVDFGATVSGKLGFTFGTGVSAAISIKKMFSVVTPIFRKLGIQKISEITHTIISYAGKIRFASISEFLSRVKSTIIPAKKFGLSDPKDVDSYIKLIEKIENSTPKIVTEIGEATSVASVIEEIKGSKVIGSALKDDIHHRSASFMLDTAAAEGKVFSWKNGDGTMHKLMQVDGSLNDEKGIFEWMIGEKGLHHQKFIKGGSITGFPNQKIKK